MSNSNLVNYTCISPNSTNPRNKTITKITIHHMAGNLSVESCGAVFAPSSRQASSNYGVGTDGRVGMYVEEKNRSWCSSNATNDHQAVTIEVANSATTSDWPVSDAALAKLIDLCVDVCQRNSIEKLNYTGDASGNLTMHKWFAATACPGPYLESRFSYIASEVNKRLGNTTTTDNDTQNETSGEYSVGDIVTFKGGAHYKSANATTASGTPVAGAAEVTAKSAGASHPYHLIHADSNSTVYGWVDAANIEGTVDNGSNVPYLVRVTASTLNIRKGAGTNYGTNGAITDKGIYTIVDESTGAGATKWGKLKSGAGWISLDYTTKI
ncbi:MAG: N-acetylmuramoyl-L-alanine amidase [Oscillospiraceae bacterium]|nr:N-acetylmuramoyl-L-alanine amidase [Oscillospiraceae bacterium]